MASCGQSRWITSFLFCRGLWSGPWHDGPCAPPELSGFAELEAFHVQHESGGIRLLVVYLFLAYYFLVPLKMSWIPSKWRSRSKSVFLASPSPGPEESTSIHASGVRSRSDQNLNRTRSSSVIASTLPPKQPFVEHV